MAISPAPLRHLVAQRSPRGFIDAADLRSFIGRSSCNGALTLARFLVSFVASVVYSRALGATGRGEVAFVIGASGVCSLLAGAGLVPGVKQLRASYSGALERAAIALVLIRAAALATAWCAICLAAAQMGLIDVGASRVAAVAGLVPITALPHAAIAIAAVDRREVALSLGMLLGGVALVASLGLLDVVGQVASSSVLLAWGLSIALPALWSLRGAARGGVLPDGVVRALHTASTRTGVAELGLYATWRMDTLMVGQMLGYRELGRYAVTTSVAECLMALIHGVRLWALGEPGHRGSGAARTSSAIKLGLLAAIPVTVSLALLGPAGIGIVFGADFTGLASTLWLLLPGVLVLGLAFIVSDELAMVGATTASSMIVASGVAMNLTLNLVLVPRFGIDGAAAASSAAYLWSFTLLWRELRRAGRAQGTGR